MSPALQPGVCRHCECTEERPCSLCLHDHGGCAWVDRSRLVCSGAPCVRSEQVRLATARAARPTPEFKGWGYGAVVLEKRRRLQRERRQAARKRGAQKGRAA
jgi:hypothetical protein